MEDAQNLLKAMGENGVMKQIAACMTDEQRKSVDDIWSQTGNITWFEAFSIWLLRSRGFEALP